MTLSAPTSTRVFVRIVTVNDRAGELLAGLRRDLGDWLRAHPRRDDAVRVSEELVSNGIRHGSRPGGWVTLIARLVGADLELDVTDSGRTDDDPPCLAAPPFGHGMRIVHALCKSVGIEDNGGRHIQVILAAEPPEIVEPDVSVRKLLDTYPDDDGLGGDDHAA